MIDNLIELLKLSKKYGNNISAEHDEFYFEGPKVYEDDLKSMREERADSIFSNPDIQKYIELGACYDSGMESWYIFT